MLLLSLKTLSVFKMQLRSEFYCCIVCYRLELIIKVFGDCLSFCVFER